MLVHEGNKNAIDIKLLLYYGSDQCWVGVFTYAMFAVIIGLNVKGHRATSPLIKFSGHGPFAGKIPTSFEIPHRKKFCKTLLWLFP